MDELPQLFNVVGGSMSLVGPRPDLAEFCVTLTGNQRHILDLVPGITGAATLAYRDEEYILAKHARHGIADYYVASIYPEKVRLDLEYASKASFIGDLGILGRTMVAIAF